MSEPLEGRKLDKGKPRWELLPFREIKDIVDVLTMGADKYEVDNWKKISDIRNRYFGALMRHLTAWWDNTDPGGVDPESGKSHLAHACCCVLFLMWDEKEKAVGERQPIRVKATSQSNSTLTEL